MSDAAGYWHLAAAWVAQGHYPDTAYRVPAYPAFLALFLAARAPGLVGPAQALAAAATVGLLWRFVRRAGGPWAGAAYLAAQCTLVDLPLFTRVTMTEVLTCALLALWVTLHGAAWRRDAVGLALGAGLAAGAALLTRPVVLPGAVLVYGWTALTGRWRAAAAGALAAGLPLVLWGWRCARTIGHFVLGEAVTGINLYLGNFTGARGFSAGAVAGPPTYALNRKLLHAALRWIAAHPLAFVALSLRRAALFWLWPVDGVDALAVRVHLVPAGLWWPALGLETAVTLAAAATCAWAAARRGALRGPAAVPLLAAGGLWVATWPFFVEARFRLPAAVLVVEAACAVGPALLRRPAGRPPHARRPHGAAPRATGQGAVAGTTAGGGRAEARGGGRTAGGAPSAGRPGRAAVAVTASAALLAGCAAPAGPMADAGRAGLGPAAWTTFQGSAGRDAVVAVRGAGRHLAARWRVVTGGALVGAPAVVDGVAYFGSMDGRVYAVAVTSGRELWSFRADNQVMGEPLVTGGRVYFGTGDKGFAGTGAGFHRGSGPSALYALDARTGRLLWRLPTWGEDMPTPAYARGVLYEPTGGGIFYAVDAGSGRVLWSVRFGSIDSMSSPGLAGGVAVFGATGLGRPAAFYGVDLADHRLAWVHVLPPGAGGSDDVTPALAGGAAFVQYHVPAARGRAVTAVELALDVRTGRTLWQRALGSGPPDFHAGEEAGVAAVVRGTVYVGAPERARLWMLAAATGRPRPGSPVALPAPVRAAPTVTGATVWLVGAGHLMAVDRRTGRVARAWRVGRRPVERLARYGDIPCASPAVTVVGDTLLVAGGSQDALLALPAAAD